MTRRRAVESGTRARVVHLLRGRLENGCAVRVHPGVLVSVRRVEEGRAVVRTNGGIDVACDVSDLEAVR